MRNQLITEDLKKNPKLDPGYNFMKGFDRGWKTHWVPLGQKSSRLLDLIRNNLINIEDLRTKEKYGFDLEDAARHGWINPDNLILYASISKQKLFEIMGQTEKRYF